MAKDVQRIWGNNQRLLLHNRNTSISAGGPLKSSLPASDPFMLIPVLLFHLCGVIPATPNSPGTLSFFPVHLESYSWVCFCEISGLLDGCQDLNSGPHKCVASTLSSSSYKFLDCLLGPQFSLVPSPRSSFHLVEHSTIPIPALHLPFVPQSTAICLCPCHLPHLLHQSLQGENRQIRWVCMCSLALRSLSPREPLSVPFMVSFYSQSFLLLFLCRHILQHYSLAAVYLPVLSWAVHLSNRSFPGLADHRHPRALPALHPQAFLSELLCVGNAEVIRAPFLSFLQGGRRSGKKMSTNTVITMIPGAVGERAGDRTCLSLATLNCPACPSSDGSWVSVWNCQLLLPIPKCHLLCILSCHPAQLSAESPPKSLISLPSNLHPNSSQAFYFGLCRCEKLRD